MKITGVERAMHIYGNQNKVNKVEPKKTPESDQFKISEHAKDFQSVLRSLRDVPDVRRDKVEALKNQVAAGTYKVDAKKVADSMIRQANISRP